MTNATGARILVVDDEAAIVRAGQTNLGGHGFRVETASTAQEALDAVARVHPDLILLDLGLPDIDGLEVLHTIRKRGNTPVVVLYARGAELDKVGALDAGADDYLTKPFGINELLARVRVALRHAAAPTVGLEPVIKLGELEVNLERRRLTPTEYVLLGEFARYADKLLTERMLREAVWGARPVNSHLLQVYIARLRQKLEVNPAAPIHLVTEPGAGYRLVTRRH